MKYEQNLTAELRYRGLPENKIAEVLAEVKAHTPAGEDPTEHFGEPAEYAAEYVAGIPTNKPRTQPILMIAVILSLVYVAFAFLAKPVLDIDVIDYIGPIRLWPALAILGLGVIVSFITVTYKSAPTINHR